MAEWSIAAVLKTVELTLRGFESLSLRDTEAESDLIDCITGAFMVRKATVFSMLVWSCRRLSGIAPLVRAGAVDGVLLP